MATLHYDDVITSQPAIIDNGSGSIKSGFAGEEIPRCIVNSYVGRPKYKRCMAGALEGDVFVGTKSIENRGILRISYPISNGIIQDWYDMETLWTHIFSELKISSEEHPVLLTEAALNPRQHREKMAEIFFETYRVPALFISTQAVLSLYSSGRTTGIVLDSGDGVTHAVPIYQGFALNNCITRSDIAGRNITEYLNLQLRRSGIIFHTSAEMEIVKQIKETACFVSSNLQKDENDENQLVNSSLDSGTGNQRSSIGYPYKLPDGQTIFIGKERFRAPELLFQPNLIGSEYPGLHEVLIHSINKTDMDLRRTLASQIVLSGGSTMFPGLGDRLLYELRKALPKDVKIRINASSDRTLLPWIGGSILGSLATFKTIWITKQEFLEEGPNVVHRKTI
ncbi:actin family protein [Cryptosporidium andersoni]|uniref:Actin family protein n=1 Tax=Cryptosporidium andersoni TaxID=117008 RepID=A0A1J4MVA1_9CRYT|nr:actin family protein [Cryptosporidium andersoni]